MADSSPLLDIKNLTKTFDRRTRLCRRETRHVAVSDVSLTIHRDECLALVGESGSGKTTLGRCLLRLVRADDGQIMYQGHDLLKMKDREFRRLRPQLQMILQDPGQALNPKLTVGSALKEPLELWKIAEGESVSARLETILRSVGLEPDIQFRYPHELSGGQRQRVAIARSLTTNPRFIIADEPTSSLDATHKMHIVDLLQDLQHRFHLALLLISHDLALVARVSNRIAVMYQGRVVEVAPTNELLQRPRHPYTKLLIESASRDALAGRQNVTIVNDQTFSNRTEQSESSCAFTQHCPWAAAECSLEQPLLKTVSPGHSVGCHLQDEAESISHSVAPRDQHVKQEEA